VPIRITERQDLESQLSQLEDELQGWQNELSQLETELAQAELTLNQTNARFPISVESIEYDEVLFSFAHDANLKITSLTASEPAELTLEGITYTTVFFTVAVNGEVADILDFINRVVADDDFQTAILEPVTIDIPDPLTDTEKENMTEEEIKEVEMPSATINLMLYTYQGEGE
jgi:predicted nuclease with TOPRIM domain